MEQEASAAKSVAIEPPLCGSRAPVTEIADQVAGSLKSLTMEDESCTPAPCEEGKAASRSTGAPKAASPKEEDI